MQVPLAVSFKSGWCARKQRDSQSARGALVKPKTPGARLLAVSRVLAVVCLVEAARKPIERDRLRSALVGGLQA